MRLGPGIGPDFESSVRGFAPIDLSGLVLWLRADLGVTLAGSKVNSWIGRLGEAATQATGAQQPTFVAAGQNGQPTIKGDTFSRLDVTGMSAPTSATYLFVLGKLTTSQATYFYSGTNNAQGVLGNIAGTDVEWFSGNGADQLVYTALLSAGLHIVTLTQVNGGAIFGYLDGVQVFTKPTAAANLQAIGALFGGAGNVTNGTDSDIPEVIAYNRVLSSGERAQVTGYLKARYAIT
jgi:hypothetical protein